MPPIRKYRKTLPKKKVWNVAHPWIDQLGKAVKDARIAAGLSQTELAQFAGCGIIFIHQLEHGKPTVRLNTVIQVLNVLGLTLKLMDGAKELPHA